MIVYIIKNSVFVPPGGPLYFVRCAGESKIWTQDKLNAFKYQRKIDALNAILLLSITVGEVERIKL